MFCLFVFVSPVRSFCFVFSRYNSGNYPSTSFPLFETSDKWLPWDYSKFWWPLNFFIIITFEPRAYSKKHRTRISKIIGKNTPPQFFSRSLRRRGYKASLGAREENREHAIEIHWLWNMSKRVKSKAVVDSDSEDSEEEVEVSTGVVIYSHQTRSLVVHTTSLSDA